MFLKRPHTKGLVFIAWCYWEDTEPPGNGASWEEVRLLGEYPWGVLRSQRFLFLSLCFLASERWNVSLHHMLLSSSVVSPGAQSIRAEWSRTSNPGTEPKQTSLMYGVTTHSCLAQRVCLEGRHGHQMAAKGPGPCDLILPHHLGGASLGMFILWSVIKLSTFDFYTFIST